MQSKDVREKYLKFFESKGHKRIAPAPLVLKDDPSTLFTSSGMQPLVPYLMGKVHPEGKRLVDSQPSLRTVDLSEVGDNRHLTLFEMLGNWSLGDYFKKEQIPWFWEFLTKELELPKERIYVTIFEGNKEVSEDKEAYEIWKSLGVSEDHIYKYDVKKNWWSRAGTPDQMPVGEIGGPDSEVFFEFDSVIHDKKYGEECHPNCDCGRFLEIGNSVFMQFVKTEKGLEELPNKNVDFGGGLERIVAATNNTADTYQTDLFLPLISQLEKLSKKKYTESIKEYRIVTDHFKSSTLLVNDDVTPSNKAHGYVLRRLIRRAVVNLRKLGIDSSGVYKDLIKGVFEIYGGVYLDDKDLEKVVDIIGEEIEKFARTLEKGMGAVGKVSAFDLFQSYGFPVEIIEELYKEKKLKLNREELEKEIEQHKESSRAGSSDKFKLNK